MTAAAKKEFILTTTIYGSIPPKMAGDVIELTEDEAKSPLWQSSVRPVPPKLAGRASANGDADLKAERDAWEKEKTDGLEAARKQIKQEHSDMLDAAQKQADKIVADAQAKADKMIADATEKVGTLTAATPGATSGKPAKADSK